MEQLLKVLEEIRPDVDFKSEKNLIDGGVLDSFDIISIVNGLDEEFDIDIDIDDLEPENFNTIEAMYELICKLQNEEQVIWNVINIIRIWDICNRNFIWILFDSDEIQVDMASGRKCIFLYKL